MSTRLYPLYKKGAPQLRVFLPNFWMKLVKPELEQPKNVAQFMVSMEMTRHDVTNYLEKIYGVKCVKVNTRIALGKTRKDPGKGYIVKNDDVKYAYVILPKNETFEFPNIFPEDKDTEKKDSEKTLEEAKNTFQKFLDKSKDKPGTPGWFTF